MLVLWERMSLIPIIHSSVETRGFWGEGGGGRSKSSRVCYGVADRGGGAVGGTSRGVGTVGGSCRGRSSLRDMVVGGEVGHVGGSS